MRMVVFAGAIAFSLSATAMGLDWFEDGDAPDGPIGSQSTIGTGPLTGIIGATGAGDFIDSYVITVTSALDFYAATDETFGNGTGFADFDTRLWLWDLSGNMMMGNDDHPGGSPFHSLITDPRSWPGPGGIFENPVELVDGQMYVLSIGGFNDNPNDAAGNPLANLNSGFSDLWGPNPAAGAFDSWELDGATGNYTIELGGATFATAPAPGALALLGLAGLAGGRRRRD